MQMKFRTAAEGALLVGLVFVPFQAHAQRGVPSALELAQMPRFCYAQFQVPNAKGEEFRIRDCGPAANHYCYALMYVIRAKAVIGKKNERATLLQHAQIDIKYTEDAIKNYPACSIREHVANSKAEVANLKKIYGVK
jgi:hypothetical protein